MIQKTGTESFNEVIKNECAYLQGKIAQTEYALLNDPPTRLAENYLNNGWRRFGRMFFRPVCHGCNKCQPLRLNVNDFKPSKSMRKILNKNSDIRIESSRPTCSKENLILHNEYHAWRTETKGWPQQELSLIEYNMLFCEDMDFAVENRYYRGNELIGVGYIDILANSISSVYFFYSPDWAPSSPGTYTILKEIEKTAELEKKYYHLGYFVEDCPSMQYKTKFQPYQLLKGDKDNWQWSDAVWQ